MLTTKRLINYPDHMLDWLKKRALAQKTNVNQVVRQLIEKEIKKHPNPEAT